MVQIIPSGEARDLDLPGRRSQEIVSAQTGSEAVTLRLVEIPVPRPGDSPRQPHRHASFEECMYILEGQGATHTDSGEFPVAAGDTVLVPAGEAHVTRNTGSTPLRMLCFFPTADCSERK